MKLTIAQQNVINKARKDIECFKKFESYDDFYNNYDPRSCEQNLLTCANSCWCETIEKARKEFGEDWYQHNKDIFNACRNDGITLVKAKKETITKLENLGLIKIIRRAVWSIDFDLIQLL